MQNLLVWGNRPIAFASPQISPKQNHLPIGRGTLCHRTPKEMVSGGLCCACMLACQIFRRLQDKVDNCENQHEPRHASAPQPVTNKSIRKHEKSYKLSQKNNTCACQLPANVPGLREWRSRRGLHAICAGVKILEMSRPVPRAAQTLYPKP